MSAREAWDLLEQTVYHRSGNTAQVMAALPENVGRTSLPYNPQLLERAFELLLEDFDLLSASEAYRYDLTEIIAQYSELKLVDEADPTVTVSVQIEQSGDHTLAIPLSALEVM